MNVDETSAIRKELAAVLTAYDSVFSEERKIAVYGMDDAVQGIAGESSITPLWEGSLDSIGEIISPCYFIAEEANSDVCGGGTYFHKEKTVITFEDAHTLCQGMLILVNSRSKQAKERMLEALHDNPIEGAEVRELNLPEILFCKHRDEVLSVYDMLEDNLSKATYANMILARMGKARQNADLIHPRQYFGVPIFAEPDIDEVYVDCGAFVGDTIEAYLWPKVGIFKKIYAFEPFKRTFSALSTRVDRLKREWDIPDEKIELINGGVGERTYQIDAKLEEQHIEEGVNLSDYSLANGAIVKDGGIPIYTIDKYFEKQHISFLKADIEGY